MRLDGFEIARGRQQAFRCEEDEGDGKIFLREVVAGRARAFDSDDLIDGDGLDVDRFDFGTELGETSAVNLRVHEQQQR